MPLIQSPLPDGVLQFNYVLAVLNGLMHGSYAISLRWNCFEEHITNWIEILHLMSEIVAQVTYL